MQYLSILLAAFLVLPAAGELPPLIPREVLVGSNVRGRTRLSPDGTRLSWLAPDSRGVVNVWVETIGKSDARAVTKEPRRPVHEYAWAPNGRLILYFQDSDGDENTHLFAADLDGRNVRDLTPFRGVRAMNLMMSASRPNEILIALNVRDRRFFDVYRADLETGALRIEAENPGDVMSWTADANLAVRAATAFDAATARTYVKVRDSADAPWRELIGWPFERTPAWYGQLDGGTMVLNFTPDGQALHVMSAAESDTLQVLRIDVASARVLEVVASHPRADVAEAELGRPLFIEHPQTHALQAVAYDYLEPEWHFVDGAFRDDFVRLGKDLPGFIRLLSRDAGDTKWIVSAARSDAPPVYFLYDRGSKALARLYSSRPSLAGAALVPKKPVQIRSRDGVILPSYLTLPAGVPPRRLPLILMIHGGPWDRDTATYDSWVQLFANRGYAVLQVNHRGSSGFGLRFLNLFTGQWTGKVIDDLADGVRWAIREGIADPKRVGAFGGSTGGFAALFGMVRHPDIFQAAAVMVVPMETRTLVEEFPPFWVPSRVRWIRRVGNVLEDDQLNRRVSPLYHAASIRRPLLIMHGMNDPRSSSVERFVSEVRKHNDDVTFVVYPDEGHGLGRPENEIDFLARVENFFAKHLGGRAEPLAKVPGATAELR